MHWVSILYEMLLNKLINKITLISVKKTSARITKLEVNGILKSQTL